MNGVSFYADYDTGRFHENETEPKFGTSTGDFHKNG